MFKVHRELGFDNTAVIGPYPCTGCGREIRVGQVYCDSCDRFIVCDTCHLAGLRLYGTRGQATAGVCPVCSIECATSTCHERMAAADGFTLCPTCDPRAACSGCHTLVPQAQLVEHTHNGGSYLICPSCETYVCVECDGYFRNVIDRSIGGNTLHICDTCAQVHYDRERAVFEKWDSTELPVSGSLLIPSTPERPIRTISIETEFDGDGVAVGRALCSAGLLPTPERDRYSTQGSSGSRHPCLLKSDGSVTGGELVSYLLDLDSDNHAAALLRVTEVLRGCREMGQAQFTHRAGGHVHIDLHGLTARDLWAQYTIKKYLELPMFHIAGAGADYGHRSLQGSDYSNPGPNGPFETVGNFAKRILRSGGRWALHFDNFNYARENCSCGAYITGEWASCSCNLGKATAEWRVFNSEITPRILHAWLALVQAITAYTADWAEFNEADYPTLAWDGAEFKPTTSITTKNAVKERLEWIFRELPLTLHERDSLVYTLKRSQLAALGDTYLDGLIDIVPNNAFGTKKPARNPGSRKEVEFALAAVAGAGAEARYVDDFYQGEDDVDYDDDDDSY